MSLPSKKWGTVAKGFFSFSLLVNLMLLARNGVGGVLRLGSKYTLFELCETIKLEGVASWLPSVGKTQDGLDGMDPGVVERKGEGVVRALWKFSIILSKRDVLKIAGLGVVKKLGEAVNGINVLGLFSGIANCVSDVFVNALSTLPFSLFVNGILLPSDGAKLFLGRLANRLAVLGALTTNPPGAPSCPPVMRHGSQLFCLLFS